MNPKQLLIEVEEVLRTMPPLATRRHPTPENQTWLGRASNALEKWDATRAERVAELMKQVQAVLAREANEAFNQIIVLLHQAQSDLHSRVRTSAVEAYTTQLRRQAEFIRNPPSPEIVSTVAKNVVDLFSDIGRDFPEADIRPLESSSDPESLRAQIGRAIQKLSQHLSGGSETVEVSTAGKPINPEAVFVIHGRQLLGEFHSFLRALGLKPLEWSEARRRTGKSNPYTWEIVDLALREAGSIVVLFTPDDEARLSEGLWGENESAVEKQLLLQPRQNVLFEAGVAYGRDPKRTVLVRAGSHRPLSDLGGHHIIQLNNSPQSRQEVADALRTAGCPVDVSGSDWFSCGDFSVLDVLQADKKQAGQYQKDVGTIRLFKAQIKGMTELSTAARIILEIHHFYGTHPHYVNEGSEAFIAKYPSDIKDQLAFNVEAADQRWSLEALKRDVEQLRIDA